MGKGAVINASDKYGNTPLHKATKNGLLETVRSLVENGTNLNLPDKRGKAPLQYANEDIKEMLLREAPPSSSMESINIAGPSRRFDKFH
ncbi:ankyrin repeat domain-containing protein [Wolbachia endosymbiont (group A) of Ennomos erosarius]|uniref:ankyrin repeat domain-containing protein n=1 Tax=Wolbachia endosymbiont (group A) of Ennomos erosarius TaxID=3066174 RepID=UPI00334177BA